MIGFPKFIISLTLEILFSYVFSEVLYHKAYAILLAFRYAESHSNNTFIMRLKRDLRKFRLFKNKKKKWPRHKTVWQHARAKNKSSNLNGKILFKVPA